MDNIFQADFGLFNDFKAHFGLVLNLKSVFFFFFGFFINVELFVREM